MTAQIADRIKFRSGIFKLFSTPPISDRADCQFDFVRISTANYRGYVAEWAIEGSQLYLNRLLGVGRLADFPDVARFPERVAPGGRLCTVTIAEIHSGPDPVWAKWVSEDLLIPLGDVQEDRYDDFGAVPSSFRKISIKGGAIVGEELIVIGKCIIEERNCEWGVTEKMPWLGQRKFTDSHMWPVKSEKLTIS